jgi:hypothetical protein
VRNRARCRPSENLAALLPTMGKRARSDTAQRTLTFQTNSKSITLSLANLGRHPGSLLHSLASTDSSVQQQQPISLDILDGPNCPISSWEHGLDVTAAFYRFVGVLNNSSFESKVAACNSTVVTSDTAALSARSGSTCALPQPSHTVCATITKASNYTDIQRCAQPSDSAFEMQGASPSCGSAVRAA